MAFISVAENFHVRRGGNRNGGGCSTGLLFSCDKQGNTGKAMRFRLGADIVQQARLIAGDRVDVLFDPVDGTGLIRRVNKGGWALSPLGGTGAKNKTGQISLNVKLTWRYGMPLIDESCECESVNVTNEGILFSFPKATVFTF